MKKTLFTLMALLMVVAAAMAVPAKPGLVRTLTLSDGSTVKAQLVGDEHGHYWLGQDGRAYQKATDADYYAVVNAEEVKTRAQLRRQQVNAQRTKRLAARRKVGTVGSYTGKKKGIIILVNFTDVEFQTSNAYFKRVVNEENFSDGDFVGSMYDYFKAQSDGLFELEFDVVGPYTVSKSQSYYGSNDSEGNDEYPATMVIEALKMADSDVNFADYDWDGDGEVDQVYIVYAGKGEADGGATTTIWPHAWSLSSAAYYGDGSGAQTLDGVKIDTYACGGELNGSTGSLGGIGTMCHEFSHCLGYPDYYDTDYSGGQGMGYWDLMDSGSYNGDGYRPAGYTTHERWAAGWREPIELTANKQVTGMKSLQEGGESYIIYNNGNRNEFFILENRQQVGWDKEIPGAGLLIVHCDYDATVWSNNEPNDDPSHQRMTWIPADNQYQYTTYQGSKYYSFSGMANDPFPYGSVNAFSASTTPAAKFYNKNSDGTYYMDSAVEKITQNADGTISFNFKGISTVATPTFSLAAGRYAEAQTVSISCTTSDATIYYTTDGTTPSASSTKYTAPITVSETTTLKAIAITSDDESDVATARYVIGAATNATRFKRVSSTSELVSGMRYVIACGSKKTAVAALNGSVFSYDDVEIEDDILTITDNVTVFTLDGSGTSFSFMNEDGKYLYATDAKKVAFGSDAKTWTLSNGTDGVEMTYGSYGTMTYNVSSPRFTTYTSNATTNMIRANLYMEYEDGTTPPTPTAGEYEATFNFPEENYGMTVLSGNTSAYNPNPTTITSDNVTLTMVGDKSSRYWSTKSTYELRVYKSCTMTIAAPENGKITKIVFAGTTVSGIKCNNKSLTNSTWTGEEESVSFTFLDTQKISTITVTYEVEGEEVVTIPGDVNKDGYVTIADVTALVNIILGKDNEEPYVYDHKAADVNQDGDITIADVTALVNLLLGK